MRELETDVAIIGAGSAGLNARREVERAGKHWLLIEGGAYGTGCARTGCMPSKLLIAAANAARSARRAELFGVRIAASDIRIDGRAVLERVRRERDRFVQLVNAAVEALPREQRLHGYARFVSANTLDVGGHTRVHAKAVVIASGSRPVVPALLQPLGAALLTSDNLFELPDLPESVAVFGSGAIGLELGQALHALGTRVTFFNPNDVLGPFSDPLLSERFRALLASEFDLRLGVTGLDVQVQPDGVLVRHRDRAGREQQSRFARVLAAVGREPASAALNLAASGLALDARGLPSCDPRSMQCADAPIFLAGDAVGERALLHEAVDEGCLAGANAARFPQLQSIVRRVPLLIAFSQPQLAMLGASFREAAQSDCVIGHSSYDDQGRARVQAENHGEVRVYVDRASTRLLGAELYGPEVEHTAHLLAWMVQAKLPLSEVLHMPVYHPTLEEGIRSALRDAGSQLGLLRGCAPPDRGEGPGS
jgi:dihydrolipoamide dehydrogenase